MKLPLLILLDRLFFFETQGMQAVNWLCLLKPVYPRQQLSSRRWSTCDFELAGSKARKDWDILFSVQIHFFPLVFTRFVLVLRWLQAVLVDTLVAFRATLSSWRLTQPDYLSNRSVSIFQDHMNAPLDSKPVKGL